VLYVYACLCVLRPIKHAVQPIVHAVCAYSPQESDSTRNSPFALFQNEMKETKTRVVVDTELPAT
jgi:hypothetical protein